jgi:hypothetical protein
MIKNYFVGSAAPFLCPLAPVMQQLAPGNEQEFFPEGLFYSSKEKAAAFFNASVETLDAWIAKGIIHPIKRGRVYFFSVAGLALALNDPRIQSFMLRKRQQVPMAKKQKPLRVKYWVLPPENGKSALLFMRVHFLGRNFVWFCPSWAAKDPKELQKLINTILGLYLKIQSEKPLIYEIH